MKEKELSPQDYYPVNWAEIPSSEDGTDPASLLKKHYRYIYRMFNVVTNNKGSWMPFEDIEDIHGDMVLAFLEKVSRTEYDPTKAGFTTFIHQRLQGAAINFINETKRNGGVMGADGEYLSNFSLDNILVSEAEFDKETGVFGELVSDNESVEEEAGEKMLLLRLLKNLSDFDRRIIIARFIDDRKLGDIAAEEGVSTSYLLRSIKRALARMRKMIARERRKEIC